MFKYTCKKALNDFTRHYTDKKIAKRISEDIKLRIKTHAYTFTSIGNEYNGVTEGAANYLKQLGYHVKRSKTNKEMFAILFKDSEIEGYENF